MGKPTNDTLPQVAVDAANAFVSAVDAGVMRSMNLSGIQLTGVTVAQDGATNNVPNLTQTEITR